jgi:hypothetical protein
VTHCSSVDSSQEIGTVHKTKGGYGRYNGDYLFIYYCDILQLMKRIAQIRHISEI